MNQYHILYELKSFLGIFISRMELESGWGELTGNHGMKNLLQNTLGRGPQDYCHLPDHPQLQQPRSLSRREQRGCGTICGDDLLPALPKHWQAEKTTPPIFSNFLIDCIACQYFLLFL